VQTTVRAEGECDTRGARGGNRSYREVVRQRREARQMRWGKCKMSGGPEVRQRRARAQPNRYRARYAFPRMVQCKEPTMRKTKPHECTQRLNVSANARQNGGREPNVCA